jgi:hypothetical protein
LATGTGPSGHALIVIRSKKWAETKMRALAIILIAGVAVNAPLNAKTMAWKKYVNARFGFSICYPGNFVPGPEPDNGDGLRFKSEDGAELTASGSYDAENWGYIVEARFAREEARKAGMTITRSIRGKNWEITLGKSDSKYRYDKIMQNNGIIYTLDLIYPKYKTSYYSSVISKMEKCFRGGPPWFITSF